MSLTYKPINGLAGTIVAELIDRESGDIFSTATLIVSGFEEEDEQSELTNIFTNINDDLIKDDYGYRKRISFVAVNGVASSLGPDNLLSILSVISMINIVNTEPDIYRLSIQYRAGYDSGIINDAIFIGNVKLTEVSARSNSGQSIQFEFRSKSTGNLKYEISDFASNILLESGMVVLLESGMNLLLESNYTIGA